MAENESYKGLNKDEILQAVNNPYNKPVVFNGVMQNTLSMAIEKPEKEPPAFLGILFLIYFCGALFVAIGFAKVDKLISLAAIGSLFLVIGLAANISNKFRVPILYIVPYVGFWMMGIPIAMIYENKHPGSVPVNLDTNFILKLCLWSMLVFSVILLVYFFIEHFYKMNKCSQIISAVCIYRTYTIEHGSAANGRHTTYASYSPVWQYEINNTIYVTEENSYSNIESAQVGSVDEIRIDPNEPSCMYRPNVKKMLIKVFVTAAWILMSILCLRFVK